MTAISAGTDGKRGLLSVWRAAVETFADSANRNRVVLWSPVLFGAGIAVYFMLPAEPGYTGTAMAAAGGLTGFLVLRKRAPFLALAVMAVLLAVAGFAAAQYRVAGIETATLSRETGPVVVSARVLRVEPAEKGIRLTLDRVDIDDRRIETSPERVRVSVRHTGEALAPGDRVRLRAILRPPPPPSLPGGFDFARKAWFERIGAVGFSLGRPERTGRSADPSWQVWLSAFRHRLTTRILAAADPDVGPVAAALLTGERRAIPEEVLADMRDSGLAHLLAISGLHIGLVAGLLFFAVRLGLALVEPVALRYPIKKIAAVAAVAGAFAYLLISGATIPTQRAFLMVSIVMLAIMVDRSAISLRLVALAASAILLFTPEALLSASFQMSFAAVIALVAAYEFTAPKTAAWRRNGGIMTSRVSLFVAATLLTTVVATLATAPFAVFHFNRIAMFGLAANMLAVPVMAMWIMPCAILAMLLMPFGLEAAGLEMMGWGIGAVLWVAGSVADLPGAVALIPPMPVAVLALFVLAGLWLCVWQGRIRLLAVPVIASAVAGTALTGPPDILIDREARFFALNMGQGQVYMPSGRGAGFERDMWRRRFAVADSRPLPDGIAAGGRLGCDGTACIAKFGTRSVAVVFDASASVDCRSVDHVILLVRTSRRSCRRDAILLSTFHLWRDGAHAIRFSDDGPVVETVREARGDRPWSALSERKRQYVRTRPTSRP